MAIVIKGIDPPRRCGGCPFNSLDWDECYGIGRCPIDGIYFPEKHGRLIDADELLKTIEANDYMLRSELNTFDRGMFTIGIQQAINEAPTIVEAEE